MAPIFAPAFLDCDCDDGPAETVDVECAVWMTVEPDCVIVKVGGFPVAMGPAVAEPAAGVVAVAPPCEEPPITLCTGPGTW